MVQESVVSSYNLFVDSSRGLSAGNKGDDFSINLQDNHISAGSGEVIRLTMDNFSMSKNFTDINENNSEFDVRMEFSADAYQTTINLTHQNVGSLYDLASDFAQKMRQGLLQVISDRGGTGVADVLVVNGTIVPAQNETNGDNVISFPLQTVDANNAGVRPTGMTNVFVQMFSDESDSYALLGGDRIKKQSDNSHFNQHSVSLDINPDNTTPPNGKIKVTCRYPAQRSTTPYIYVRCPNVLNNNIETQGLLSPADSLKSDTASSDILGRVVVDTEWVQYTAQTGREFFLDIHQKSLSHLRLKLTDSHNRPIARKAGSGSLTATGSGTQQATLGNLQFSCVLRIDIIKKYDLKHNLREQNEQLDIPARFSNGLVTQMRGGFAGTGSFGKPPGY